MTLGNDSVQTIQKESSVCNHKQNAILFLGAFGKMTDSPRWLLTFFEKIIHNMFHHTHLDAQFYQLGVKYLYFLSSPLDGRAIIKNKMS